MHLECEQPTANLKIAQRHQTCVSPCIQTPGLQRLSARKVDRIGDSISPEVPAHVRLLSFALLLAPVVLAAEKPIDFAREVRPILSDKCFRCHGPDEKSRMANLRLDTREGAVAKAVVPGDPAASKLFQRITHAKPALRMPPPASGLTLTDKETAALKKWIESGAKWEMHWAYEVPKRVDPPAVQTTKWARNSVDQFVLARLERDGLKPSPEADRITLLRRATYDLTGLPPTPAEVDAFLSDKSPNAYEKVLDRLFASPHYGERMAMQWLDLARYSDTHGYHIDSHRDMWPWRDWVIKAFNTNMPYDRFTIEQLAGDLLPNATVDQRVATGFNRNHMINFEGGAIPEEYLNEYVVDRVDTTTTVWLGSTFGCARCHDHKYDPIKQKDYYSLYAFFNSVPEKGLDGRAGNAEPILQLPTPQQAAELERVTAQTKIEEAKLDDKLVSPLLSEWASTKLSALPKEPRIGLLAHYDMEGSFGDLSGSYRNGRILKGEVNFVSGPVGRAAELKGETKVDFGSSALPQTFTLALWLKSGGIYAMPVISYAGAFSIWAGESMPLGNLTRGAYLYLIPEGGKPLRTSTRLYGSRWVHLALTKDSSGWKLLADGNPEELVAATDSPVNRDLGPNFKLPLGFTGSVDDLRLYSQLLTPAEVSTLVKDQPVRAALFEQESKRSKDQNSNLREYFLTHDAPSDLREAFARLTALKAEKLALDRAIPSTMVMKEMDKPRETHILARGDYRTPGDKVTPAVPGFLPGMPADARPNRLALAKWVVDPQNPLTSRVAVNRYWAMFFGTGLVKTVEDFGSQGEAPSHPELLDWLATEFVRTNWDAKAMQKLMLTSATYRQSSKSTPELNERDPENRLLSRGPRFRLPAEMIRDGALASSGLLDTKVGGPSVFPYSPKGLWEDIAFGDVYSAQTYPQNTSKSDYYRRSFYTFWKRTAPPPGLNTFDAPDREKCTARRPLTNTPLQALVLLNDPTFVEAARVLAQRMLLEGGADASKRIQHGFRLVTGRIPTPKELAILRELLKRETSQYDSHPDQAAKLIAIGAAQPDPKADKILLAAWTTVASAILNLDEAVTKE